MLRSTLAGLLIKDDVEMAKGKQKTHKGVSKRVTVTKSGKIKRNKAWKRHLNAGKSSARKRQLRRKTILVKSEQKRFRRLLGLQ